LNLALLIGNHFRGEALAEPRELSKKSSVVRIDLKRFDLDTVDQVGRVQLRDHFAKSFGGTARDSQLDAISSTERNNFGLRFLRCGQVSRHCLTSPPLREAGIAKIESY
jgi:hypothetical protein